LQDNKRLGTQWNAIERHFVRHFTPYTTETIESFNTCSICVVYSSEREIQQRGMMIGQVREREINDRDCCREISL
jgi:hypothetical protein